MTFVISEAEFLITHLPVCSKIVFLVKTKHCQIIEEKINTLKIGGITFKRFIDFLLDLEELVDFVEDFIDFVVLPGFLKLKLEWAWIFKLNVVAKGIIVRQVHAQIYFTKVWLNNTKS